MPIFSYCYTFPNFDGKLTWANKKEKIPSKTFPMPPVEEKGHTVKATEKLSPDFLSGWFLKNPALRGGSRIFPMRRSTTKKYLQIHLLLFQNTTYFRKPQFFSGGGGGVRTPCTPPLHSPLKLEEEKITYLKLVGGVSGNW